MELRDFITTIKSGRKTLIWCILIGTALGILIYILPPGYTATGSLYIGRKTDASGGYFTYEGYYGQQTALAYTNTVSGLLESREALRGSLTRMGITVDEYALLKFRRDISVKKTGPQLITLTVKSDSKSLAADFWGAVADTTIELSENVTTGTDNNLQIIKVSDNPVVSKNYKSPIIYPITGMASGFFAGIMLISLKVYLSSEAYK